MKEKLKIGKVELENKVILAPMAGVTDITFRTICKEFGIGLVTTEMVSSKALFYQDKKTQELMVVNPANRPIALQLFGHEPEVMAHAVENKINQMENIDIIDVNMGCPAPKIVKNGDGSAILKNPKLAGEIVKAIKKVALKPVTVKIRAGWDDKSINAVEVSKILEDSGADAIAVHGRTREQFYSGKADYSIIRKVKESIKSIPIIGNGDVFTPEAALKIIEETSCDGILLARGVLGNPWLITNVIRAYEGRKDFVYPTPVERVEMLKKHSFMLSKVMPERLTVLEMRKHAAWYIKGLRGSNEVRNRINTITSLDELFKLLEEYSSLI